MLNPSSHPATVCCYGTFEALLMIFSLCCRALIIHEERQKLRARSSLSVYLSVQLLSIKKAIQVEGYIITLKHPLSCLGKDVPSVSSPSSACFHSSWSFCSDSRITFHRRQLPSSYGRRRRLDRLLEFSIQTAGSCVEGSRECHLER